MSEEENQVVDIIATQPSRNKKRNIIFLVIIAIIAAGAFYFFYWVKTPQYSIGIIRDSIQKHDLVKFEKHVDMQSLYSRAFDDVIAISLKEENQSNKLAIGLAATFKPIAITTFIDQTKRYIESGNDQGSEPQVAPNDEKKLTENFKQNTGANSLEFKGIESTDKDGKIAIVNIKIFDKQLSENFILKIKMRELEDGTWCLIEIANLKEYLIERQKAIDARILELNAPIKDKINNYVKVLFDKPNFFSTVSKNSNGNKYSPTYSVTSDIIFKVPLPDVKHIGGIVEIYNQENKQIFTGDFNIQSSKFTSGFASEKTYKLVRTWKLNPLITKDKAVIDYDFSKITYKISITSVEFSDGTDKLELLKELPKS